MLLARRAEHQLGENSATCCDVVRKGVSRYPADGEIPKSKVNNKLEVTDRRLRHRVEVKVTRRATKQAMPARAARLLDCVHADKASEIGQLCWHWRACAEISALAIFLLAKMAKVGAILSGRPSPMPSWGAS